MSREVGRSNEIGISQEVRSSEIEMSREVGSSDMCKSFKRLELLVGAMGIKFWKFLFLPQIKLGN